MQGTVNKSMYRMIRIPDQPSADNVFPHADTFLAWTAADAACVPVGAHSRRRGADALIPLVLDHSADVRPCDATPLCTVLCICV